jgi:kinesin light chain
MIQLGNHLQNLEAEKHKLRTQVKRLCQENAWLRDELASSQKKLHDSEQSNATYSVELEHLKFMKEIKQYDVNENTSTSNNNPSSTNVSSGQTNDIVNDLFPNDDDNYIDQHEGGNQSKRFDSYAGSFISSTGYEIPARLKTLHNLVIQYASQGRYEVAVPLCRQALEDLEKTSGHQRKFYRIVLIFFLIFVNLI